MKFGSDSFDFLHILFSLFHHQLVIFTVESILIVKICLKIKTNSSTTATFHILCDSGHIRMNTLNKQIHALYTVDSPSLAPSNGRVRARAPTQSHAACRNFVFFAVDRSSLANRRSPGTRA